MNKYLFVVSIMVVALLAAACVPAPSAPAPSPTVAAAVPQPPAAPAGAVSGTPTPDARPTVPVPPADGSRPLAKLSPIERNERFSGPAAPYTKPGVMYVATIVTDKGNIVAELYPDAVQSVNNFVTLAKTGFYDGLTFHRVEPGFVIQGGDPKGEGVGGPGYTIPAEINHTHARGALAWARTGDQVNPERRSSGSQFYITLDETPFLDGQYTVFGLVVEGMEVADQIAVGDKINRIDITEAAVSRLPTPTPTPVPKAPQLEPGRPLAAVPFEKREGLYNTPPAMAIDPAKTYSATIEAPQGKIVIKLENKKSPEFINNFVVLANLGFYDGMPVAFVQPRPDDPESPALAILGSPGSNQESDVGYVLKVETGVTGLYTGTVSMYPAINPYTGEFLGASGSQFFMSFLEEPDTGVELGILGQIVEGLDVAMKLKAGDLITRVTISEQ